MLKPVEPPPPRSEPGANGERPIGELVHQLVDEGKAYAQAELGVAKAIATAKAEGLKVPAILLGAALLFVQAAVTILVVATFWVLLPLIGPVLAGLLAFLIFAGIGGGMAWYGIDRARRNL